MKPGTVMLEETIPLFFFLPQRIAAKEPRFSTDRSRRPAIDEAAFALAKRVPARLAKTGKYSANRGATLTD